MTEGRPFSFYEAIAEMAGIYPDKSAIADKNAEYTYSGLLNAIDNYSDKLAEMGITKGSHVALWSVNSTGWIISYLSILKLGGVAILCNYSLTADELRPLMKKCDTEFIAFGSTKETDADPDAAFSIGESIGVDASRIFRFEDEDFGALAGTPVEKREIIPLTKEQSMKDPAFVIFTTGTTSEPKAVVLPQYGLLESNYLMTGIMKEMEKKISCIAVPLYHVMALLTCFNYLVNGGKVVLLDRFSVDSILELGQKYEITSLTTVGTVHLKLIEDERFRETLAKTVTNVASGGGALTEAQFLKIETAYDNARLLNGYGQTETSGIIAIAHPEDSVEIRTTTVGAIYPGKDIRIKDPSKGYLETGEIGEVVACNRSMMMLGYYGLPEDEQPFDEDGDLHTGDLGFVDENGYLHLAGRIKDIIIKGGENISPFEIERAITEAEGIRDAKVIGMPDPIYGENIEAAVTMASGAVFDEAAIKKSLKKSLGAFKIPAHILLFDDFPLNANNKIDQRTLKLDMAKRLREIKVDEALTKGILLFETVLKNADFMITPVSDMLKVAAKTLGFSQKRAENICLSCEEMLTERIVNAYVDVGDVTLSVVLMPEFMRVRFGDSGMEYDIHKDESTNISARLILKYVDGFTTLYPEQNKRIYCMDFLYDKDFDVREFLIEHTTKQ
ncbi:MAG: AMP-binding protein [Lachnospiraceae bacterium]|nr:AMP-binding protein [Lachnospiraceae bacterium]